MSRQIHVALIGDYNPSVLAHQAIPRALDLAGQRSGLDVTGCWIDTDRMADAPTSLLEAFDAFWCVPASPYRSTAGALRAIRHARESNTPFLGTCGGFQHALLELGRNMLAIDGAHAELEPGANAMLIAPLECALVEKSGTVRFVEGSRLHDCYGHDEAMEGYHCSYGFNREYRAAFESAGVRFTAFDDAGDVRGFELEDETFFVGTLFQPERAALRGAVSPPVEGLIRAAAHLA